MNKINVTSPKVSMTPAGARWPPRRHRDGGGWGWQVELELLDQKVLGSVQRLRISVRPPVVGK